VATYREDMRKAWERINLFPTQRLETRLGTIEYADQGQGTPLLVSHGVLGCHVDTVDSWWANLPGSGFGVIGPSRFGYFGSTLPKGATPADPFLDAAQSRGTHVARAEGPGLTRPPLGTRRPLLTRS
jgi:hypothetical protein